MITIELTIDAVDYEAALQLLLPYVQNRSPDSSLGKLLSGGLSKAVLKNLPQSKKDALAAQLINANSGELRDRAGKLAAENGVPLKVLRITAKA